MGSKCLSNLSQPKPTFRRNLSYGALYPRNSNICNISIEKFTLQQQLHKAHLNKMKNENNAEWVLKSIADREAYIYISVMLHQINKKSAWYHCLVLFPFCDIRTWYFRKALVGEKNFMFSVIGSSSFPGKDLMYHGVQEDASPRHAWAPQSDDKCLFIWETAWTVSSECQAFFLLLCCFNQNSTSVVFFCLIYFLFLFIFTFNVEVKL